MVRFKLIIPYLYSLLFCLRYLPFWQAIHVPVLIHPFVKIDRLSRGSIKFIGELKHSMLVFGFKGTTGTSNCRSLISIGKGATLVVKDGVSMARGTRLVIHSGCVSIGRNFWCNGDCIFFCTTKISIGDDNMYGWNINFNTSDGHSVYVNGEQKPMEGDIEIGNHVWIASYCNIAKNTYVANDCVVAQCSLVNGRHEEEQCLIGGVPAKKIKENVRWKA